MADGSVTIIVKDVNDILIDGFKYIINLNNVGDPQVELPENSRDPSLFPSLKPVESYSPVILTGESATSQASVTIPEGKYIISVLAPGYKMGGNWVTVLPGDDTIVEVKLYPNPLPLSKIRVRVFEDNHPVNGEDDIPLERGLKGFRVVISDAVGEVTVDYFGNPLGTQYEKDINGDIVFDSSGNPIPIPDTGGVVLTDENGLALIDNIPPGKYAVQAIPPDGTDWIQTTTIEGTHEIDVWIEEGNDGYSPREGFKVPLVWIGFVKPMKFEVKPPSEVGTVTGRIMTVIEFVPPFRPLTLGRPVERPWIALTDIGANDQQVYTGRGNVDGTFTIENVPPGIYQMAIWDEPLDYIISFRTVQVAAGQTVNMGDIGIPRWYGYIEGDVFYDENEDAELEPGDTGIPNVEMFTRFKDGSIQYMTISDMKGKYLFNEVFELERFAVAEVGFTRFKKTGGTAVPDYGNPAQKPPITEQGALTMAELTWAAKTNKIDWGKKAYGSGESGGISGMVYYATMRNETDPRMAAAEDYEPGIPNVTVNLYATEEIDGQIVQGQLIGTVTTDAWQHPTGCTDADNNPVPCLEVPNISNQIRPGVFDGRYAFETLPGGTYIVEVVPPAGYKVIDQTGSVNTGEGDEYFIDTTITSRAQGLKEEISATGCIDEWARDKKDLMTPPPYYEPPETPGSIDIYKKIVKVIEGRNSTADFFLYTDVPVPGRIVGFLLDDVNIETDPARIYFGEKRGIPDTPVGIRDFKGKLITTVHSDINGIFEVLLPSTYTRNVPIPSGVVPGMYLVVGNDPGDPDRPNPLYNPNYQSLTLVFDVWPGKTTYADVALFPITAFTGEVGGAQFSQPPQCNLKDDVPQVFKLSRVEVDADSLNDMDRTFTIYGRGFGSSGTVTLDGVEIDIIDWTPTSIEAKIPPGFTTTGPAQLIVTNALGNRSINGITFHVRKNNIYWPDILHVKKDGTGDYTTIQDAIDNAPDGTIIVVHEGTFYESPILYKNVKLQGLGPGGLDPNNNPVIGSVIDGRFFLSYLDQWLAKLDSIDFDGPELVDPGQVKEISRGQVITVVAKENRFSSGFRPQIDGFKITGARGEDGGGIYINAHCNYLVISNNVIQSNGGGFGGGITIGKAYAGNNYNSNITISHNQILNNGGISLAGGIGIFNGADDYSIEYNFICGNYSAEYGGGISHFGLSRRGKIHHNIVQFNNSFDEGAGIFIGGEQPVPPAVLTRGSGEVDIYNNLIRGNVANDDGGGLRLLQPLDYRINIYNNMIVNNVSTDLGGGIALDDASNVVIVNNTIAKNITTATAEDSDRLAHGAGLASELNSAAFQAVLPPGSDNFSNPILFNNIFWDNRAGIYDQTLNGGTGGIWGIGNYGEPVTVIDLEVYGTSQTFNPRYCILTNLYGGGSNNIVSDPLFVEEYNIKLSAIAFNMEPDFISVKIVTVVPEILGNYHITGGSPAIDQGVSSITDGTTTYFAPNTDFDDNPRPQGAGYDIGADEYMA
jgi:hypothetical protein